MQQHSSGQQRAPAIGQPADEAEVAATTDWPADDAALCSSIRVASREAVAHSIVQTEELVAWLAEDADEEAVTALRSADHDVAAFDWPADEGSATTHQPVEGDVATVIRPTDEPAVAPAIGQPADRRK